jgi:hypothetical protein
MLGWYIFNRRFGSMIRKSGIAISAAIIVTAVSTAFAKDGGLPKLNTEYACHASAQAVAAIISVDTDLFASCMSDENEARQQLEKDWAKYPGSDKDRCIQTKEYLPGYVEWLTCLEMERDVKLMRKDQPGTQNTADKCPVVRYLGDGTILSVNTAC